MYLPCVLKYLHQDGCGKPSPFSSMHSPSHRLSRSKPFLKRVPVGSCSSCLFFFFLFLRAKCTFCLLELLFFHNRDSELKKKNTYQSLHWSKAFSPIVWIKSITEMFVKASEESCFTAQKINIRISCVKSTSLKYYG